MSEAAHFLPAPAHHGDSVCAVVPCAIEIVPRYPAQRKYRKAAPVRQSGKAFPAEWHGIGVRGRRLYRPEHREIGPEPDRAREFRRAVTGCGAPTERRPSFQQRELRCREMYAVGAKAQCEIDVGVDQHLRAVRPR